MLPRRLQVEKNTHYDLNHRYRSLHAEVCFSQTRVITGLSFLALEDPKDSSFHCSDALDDKLAALEQKILEVEAEISAAGAKAVQAKADEDAEEVKYWRSEKEQLRVEKRQLRDEELVLWRMRAEILQQGTTSCSPLNECSCECMNRSSP